MGLPRYQASSINSIKLHGGIYISVMKYTIWSSEKSHYRVKTNRSNLLSTKLFLPQKTKGEPIEL